ncbi:MAG: hypothetical protein J6F31_06145 [Oscillospiraceae bacterium]|nr:hypothetical protein [Oscillospiraceae bacterium]
MDKITKLLTDERSQKRFANAVSSVLRRSGYTVKMHSCYFCTVSDGEYSVDMDYSYLGYGFNDLSVREVSEKALRAAKLEFETLGRLTSFTNGQNFLRFKAIAPESVTDDMITEDFPGGIKKVMCYTSDNIHGRILGREYMKKWDIPLKVLFSVADRNMSMHFERLRHKISNLGSKKCAEFTSDSTDFGASLVMCTDLYRHVSPIAGERFIVCIPSFDSFVAIEEPVERDTKLIADEMWDEDRRWSDSLTASVYLFTPQGTEVIPPPEFIR